MPTLSDGSHSRRPTVPPDVYSARELATVAGVRGRDVKRLIASADIPTVDGTLVSHADALAAIRGLRSGGLSVWPSVTRPGVFGTTLLGRHVTNRTSQRLSALMSAALHATAFLMVALLTTVSLRTASDDSGPSEQLTRLVFVSAPGPGGGGGGGGLQMPEPPPKAAREGSRALSSPLPERITQEQMAPAVQPFERVLDVNPLPRFLAPVVAAAANPKNIRGLVDNRTSASQTSSGAGKDGGVGTGAGTGLESGRGSGLGRGSGGGFGGGAYRPGSGIAPPRLIHEERPQYTESARQRDVTGDVLLEVVVLRDGSVGDVRLLRRLGSGLDEEAIQAVRQWRFLPAEWAGIPVDVVVEIAVEFKLR